MKDKDLEKSILPNEQIITEAKFNVFGRIVRDILIGVSIGVLCILICQFDYDSRSTYKTVESICLFVGVVAFFWMVIDIIFGIIELMFSECILTNRRIIVKVRRNLIMKLFSEIPNNRTESVTFVQSFLGHWLNYGTLVLGASKIRVRFVKYAYEFRNQIVIFVYSSEQ